MFRCSEESSKSSSDEGNCSSSSEEDDELDQLSSDEETGELEPTSRKRSALVKEQKVAKPTLQLPSGFRWDLGEVKGESGVPATSSESEGEANRDEKEVRVQ